MSRSPFLIAGLALLVLAAESGVPRDLEAKPRGRPAQVSADDLATGRAAVIGKLGIPLKTMATIRGVWKDPHVDKEAPPRFCVTHIDGRALKEPVEFERTQVEVYSPPIDDERAENPGVPAPNDGHLWEFRGFETGAFHRRPEEFEELRGTAAQQQPNNGKFVTRLEGVIPQPGEKPVAAEKSQQPRPKVSAEDLNSGKAAVIGRMQLPLQTMATIRGVWKYPPRGDAPAKEGSATFHVTHINGDLVKQPIALHRDLVRMSIPRSDKVEREFNERHNPKEGEAWEFRGFETGGFFGTPAEFREMLRLPVSAAAVWQRGEFVTHLEGIFANPTPEKPQNDLSKAVKAAESDDHTLIVGLRNRNKPAGRYSAKRGRPVFPDDYDWEEQARVITLWRKIDARSADLLRTLVQHMDDPEYCVTFSGVAGNYRNHSVGDICRLMVERSVMPVKLYDEAFRGYSPWSKTRGGIKAWLASRRHMTLPQIQREVLSLQLEHLNGLDESTLDGPKRRVIEEELSQSIKQIDETRKPIHVDTSRGDGIDFVNFPVRKDFKEVPLEKGR